MSNRVFGVVEWFGSKGQAWGSIDKDGGGRIFVHYKNILGDNQKDPNYKVLVKGQRVSFEEAPGHFMDGTQAVKVKIEDERVGSPVSEIGELD